MGIVLSHLSTVLIVYMAMTAYCKCCSPGIAVLQKVEDTVASQEEEQVATAQQVPSSKAVPCGPHVRHIPCNDFTVCVSVWHLCLTSH